MRELQPTDARVSVGHQLVVVRRRDALHRGAGDHAGEAETSAMMHLAPDLVRPLEEAGAGRAKASRLRGIREGWAWAPRRWTQVTSDTGIGDPSKSTAEKGEAYVAAAVERIAEFLVELAAVSLDDLYA